MRAVFKPNQPMPSDKYGTLFENSEVSRATVYILERFGRVGSLGYDRSNLRQDLVVELKALRAKTEKKEAITLHPKLYEEVLKILWDKK